MKCNLLSGLCLFCTVLAAGIVFVLLYQAPSCPLSTFRCQNTSICLPRRHLCDGRPDCPDGTDEDRLKCTDYHGELDSLGHLIDRKSTPTPTTLTTSTTENPVYYTCAIELPYPRCICRNRNWLSCTSIDGLDSVPTVDNVSRIVLANNTIRRVAATDFHGRDLELIHLDGNQLMEIDENAFHGQSNLRKLYLKRNNLTRLRPGTFRGLRRLEWLFLRDNQLEGLDFSVFAHLPSLHWLDLSQNRLAMEPGNPLPFSESLKDLMLNDNHIEVIDNDTFAQLPNLFLLDLKYNYIKRIDEDAFVGLAHLKFLDLSHNELEHIPRGLFSAQRNLTKLSLSFNPIVHLVADLFLPLISLRSLGLDGIDIPDISTEMFSSSGQLDFVYFKTFRYCAYVAQASKCQPLSDGVSSFADLISNKVHRVCLWIIGILTVVGNAMVLGGRGLAKPENRILSCFVKNLAAADMCIGIYLLCIGERDHSFRGQYNLHAHEWMISWQCTVIRILAVTTSEVSLLLLTFMSVERFVSISHPFGERKLTFRTALISIVIIWTIGLCLSIIPVFHWHEVGQHHGSNGLCFPLHMNEPDAVGWQYSAFLYIGINGSCVLVIVLVYSLLFLSIRRTRHATPLAPNEIEIAIRFFFIVFTDCLCWMPTIILKILALSKIYIPADLYAWLVVFILPVNSAINPFLYTFTTPVFRATVRDLFRRTIDYASVTAQSQVPSRSIARESSVRNNDFQLPLPLTERSSNSITDDETAKPISMAALRNSALFVNPHVGDPETSSKLNSVDESGLI